MAEIIFMRVDVSGINLAGKIARETFSKRSPELGANTAMFFIMRGLAKNVRKATVSSIDAELAVTSVPGVTATGRPSKAKKNRVHKGGFSSIQRRQDVPLSYLIVLARANISKQGRATGQSNYNKRTNNRFALTKSDLVGGRSHVERIAHRMISARHSATAFLASCVIPVIRGLERVVESKYRRGAAAMDSTADRHARKNASSMELGLVTPAVAGEIAFCYMELRTGVHGGGLSESQNRALHEILGPELQRQIDLEAEKTFNEVVRRYGEEALIGPLRQLGVAA